MTITDLLNALKGFTEECTKDILLKVADTEKSGADKTKPADIHLYNLPEKKHNEKFFPYIIIRPVTTKYSGVEENACLIRMIFGVYDPKLNEGEKAISNLMTTLTVEFLKSRILDHRFQLSEQLETFIYQDNTPPYMMGEMMTTWKLPPIEREVSYEQH